ncbi:MAG TPA: pantetheine-phosphate adenylyltransferase [Planctomycetota bacterium]|nr:pantetheine-phosphate adenylyltransferase [Planctomycetota bacterium]
MGDPHPDPRHALFPGTFDPVTLGHLDLVRRASGLFARLTVAVASNPQKQRLLDQEQRMALLREVTAGLGNVEVIALDGLVALGALRLGAGVILRGARHAGDFEYEAQMARSNRALAPRVETLILVSAPEHAHISSTLVRQIAGCGGPLEGFVPPAVARALANLTHTP